MTRLDELADLQQMCDGPSDGFTQGEWCFAANRAVEIAWTFAEGLRELRQYMLDGKAGPYPSVLLVRVNELLGLSKEVS